MITSKLKTIELLAPAKDLESGIAAIDCGADAIYIGATRFGARSAAHNPISTIESLSEYAHKFNAKVYVTLNTILFENELAEAQRLATDVWNAGADALIIQDMGLLEMNLPPIPLFASTQANNYSLAHIQFLEKVGFQRVILARELSIEQVREIRAATSIELEYFIHGALCVCFSGQCYMSAAKRGRSANRGECAQPCRLQYTLEDNRGAKLIDHKHLLSLKDLNLSDQVEELIDAGICSFKIEGRLKDIQYIRNVTAHYRQRIDKALEHRIDYKRSSTGSSTFDFDTDPARTFNRGYTTYFIEGRNHEITSFDTPKSIGKFVGTVTSVSSDSLEIRMTEKLNTGDGICFFDETGDLGGFNINRIRGNNIYPHIMPKISVGAQVFRNYDIEFSKKLLNSKTRRAIDVRFILSETQQGVKLHAVDIDGQSVEVELHLDKKEAVKSERIIETIRTQLAKSGSTIFAVTDIWIDIAKPFMIPISKLNQLRRDTLSALECQRMNGYQRFESAIEHTEVKYPKDELTYLGNVANSKAQAFYRRHGVDKIEPAFEISKPIEATVLMTTKHCLKYELNACPKASNQGSQNSPLEEPLYLVRSGNRFKLDFDCKECVMKIVQE
jgi:putative protease